MSLTQCHKHNGTDEVNVLSIKL